MGGCQQKAPTPSRSASASDGRIVGKWQENNQGGKLELRADGTGAMRDKGGSEVSFSWLTEGEKLTISNLSAPSSVWPVKEGRYSYLYHASEQIKGVAFFEVTTEDGKTSWSMDRS
jgi:hypothetical protein